MSDETKENKEPPIKAFLVRVDDGRIGVEPEAVEVRLIRQRELGQREDVIKEIDLESGWCAIEKSVTEAAGDAPYDVRMNWDPDDDEIRQDLMFSLAARLNDLLKERQLEAWPDVYDRIMEKRLRQRAMKFLPDDEIVVQVCKVEDLAAALMGRAPEVVAFMVSKAAQVVDGLHFRTVASMSVTGNDETMLEEVAKRVREEGAEFTFKPCEMASDDIVAEWRLRLERVGLLEPV